MNVSNFASLFHQNGVFQPNRLGQKLTQPPASEALNRLSESIISGQEREENLKARFDTVELSAEAEAADREEEDSLEELPEDILRYFLNMYKVNAYLSQQHEAALMEYRDQLSTFDLTIQGYQDILDGKADPPDQMGMEDVSRLLEAARAARAEFLQRGAAELNRLSENNPTQTGYMWKPYSTATERSKEELDTRIDASSEDIYGEIDRALANARNVTSTFEGWASSIQAELKRRGCEQELYMVDRQKTAEAISARPSLFQSIYEDIWNIFRRSAVGHSEPTGVFASTASSGGGETASAE